MILNRSALFCTAILVNVSLLAVAQAPPPRFANRQPANAPRLSPQDLGNLVRPSRSIRICC